MYLIPVVGFVIGVVIGLCAYVVDEFMKRTTRALAMIQKGIALKDIQDRGDPPEYSENEEISEMSKIPHEMLLVTVKDSDNKICDAKYQQIRKRILDHGNDTIREIEEDLNKFNITL